MKEKILSTLPTLQAAFKAVLFMLRLTTYVVLGLLTYNFFVGKVPMVMAYTFAGILTYLGGYAIDGLLDRLLPLAATQGVTGAKNERLFIGAVRVIAFILLLITGTLSWWAMPEVASVAIKAPDDTEALETIRQYSTDTRATIEQKAGELAEAKRTERSRIAQAKREGAARVQNAIAAGPSKYRELWTSGNDWIRTERRRKYQSMIDYRKSIQQAQADSAAMVEREQLLASTLQSEKGLLEVSRTSKADSLSTTLATLAATRQHRYENRIGNLTNVLLVMDITWMLLALALAWMIGLVDGHEFRADNKTALKVLFDVVTEYEQAGLKKIEWHLIGRANSANTNANKGANKFDPSLPTVPTPAPTMLMPIRNPPAAPTAPNDDITRMETERLQRELVTLRQEMDEKEQRANKQIEVLAKAKEAVDKPLPTVPTEPPANSANTVANSVNSVVNQIQIVVGTDGEPTVPYTKQDGETAYYTLRDVRKVLATYRGRKPTANNLEKIELFEELERQLVEKRKELGLE